MNLVKGNVIISLGIEDIRCYHLCKHFHDTFKNIINEKENSGVFCKILMQNEMKISCDNCKIFFQATISLKKCHSIV